MQQEFNHGVHEGHEENNIIQLYLRALRALRGVMIERVESGITNTRAGHLVALAPAAV